MPAAASPPLFFRMLTIRLFAGGQRGGLGKRLERLHGGEAVGNEVDPLRPLREDRLDLVCGVALLAEMAAQSIVQKVGECFRHRLRLRDAVECLERQTQQAGQRQRQALFEHDAQHADCGTAQSERIAVSRGKRADAEHAGQRFQLVGERNGLRDRPVQGSASPA